MISALTSALAGLQTASQRLEETGARVARAEGTAAAPNTVQLQPSTSGPVPAGPGPSVLAAQEVTSLAGDLVSAKEAEILYKASAKLIGAIADTQSELLDIET